MARIGIPMDTEGQAVRIEPMITETRKYIEGRFELQAESRKLTRDASIAPFSLILGTLTAGAALFGAGAAFVKLLGP